MDGYNAFLTIRFHSRRIVIIRVSRERETRRGNREKQTRGNDKSSDCSKMLSKKDGFRLAIFNLLSPRCCFPDAHRRTCIDIYNSIAKKGTAETTS